MRRVVVAHLTLSLLLSLSSPALADDSFDERLSLDPLADGKLSARFTFKLSSDKPANGLRAADHPELRLTESDLLPPALNELVDRFGLAELGLSLAKGRWRADRWGRPSAIRTGPDDDNTDDGRTMASVPAGAELWAWLRNRPGDEADVEIQADDGLPSDPVLRSWHGLTHALGGLTLVRGLLPIEHPCTENLSPLLSLLPCRGRAGLASLLDPHRLFEADWQALTLHLVRRPDPTKGLVVTFSFHAVLDPVRRDITAGGPGSRGPDWSLESLFGKQLALACPVARTSDVQVSEAPHATISAANRSAPAPNDGVVSFTLSPNDLPHISQRWPDEKAFSYPSSYQTPRLAASRVLTAVDQRTGVIGVEIEPAVGPHNGPFSLVYTEELPWWLSLWTHTLQLTIDGQVTPPEAVIRSTRLTPSLPRRRPTSLSLTLDLPPFVRRVRLTLGFTTSLLRYTEYAPDAHRGFDVPPANVVMLLERTEPVESAWTAGALVELATPDFSMPYNVIIVTSTVIALFFGSLFNLLVRSFAVVAPISKR